MEQPEADVMKSQTVRIIGIPIDLGQNHRGVDMGPSAVRYAGLHTTLRKLGYQTEDRGDITVPGHYTLNAGTFSERLPLIRAACEQAYQEAYRAMVEHTTPIFLGGDHSAAIGSIGGVSAAHSTGLIWVDAHGDFNTPEISESCNVHGMALAIVLGMGPPELVNVGRAGAKLPPENVVLMGVRDLDRLEKERIRDSGITVYTMRDIDEVGMHTVLTQALAALSHCARLHLSLDMDCLDPHEAPGVGTPVPGGLTYREAQLIMETICDTGRLGSMDIMETNPILDVANRTAQTAVSLTGSLFGKSIL
jgi:arginase